MMAIIPSPMSILLQWPSPSVMDHELLTGVSGLMLMNLGMILFGIAFLFGPLLVGKRLKDDDQDR
jgi:hypothetical protein